MKTWIAAGLVLWAMAVGAEQVYYGNLHSHTSNSDGVADPTEAFSFARNTGHLDFLAVTDHSQSLTPAKYAQTREIAAGATEDGKFVALCGQEWTTEGGHAVVLDAPVLFGAEAGHCDVPVGADDYPTFYTQLLAHPGEYGAFCIFAHPDAKNFHSFALPPEPAREQVTYGIEVYNVVVGATFEPQYESCLAQGWTVVPLADQDNHQRNWGTVSPARTGIWATGLTKGALLEGLKARRCFATQDANATVDFTAEETTQSPLDPPLLRGVSTDPFLPRGVSTGGHRLHLMGERFAYSSTIRLRVNYYDADGEPARNTEVKWGTVGQGMHLPLEPLYARHPGWFVCTPPPQGEHYFYVKITQADGDVLWSAPIWIDSGAPAK